jgi:hypothetical protein
MQKPERLNYVCVYECLTTFYIILKFLFFNTECRGRNIIFVRASELCALLSTWRVNAAVKFLESYSEGVNFDYTGRVRLG